MSQIDPYEQWARTRRAPAVDPAFTDRVMQTVRQLPSHYRPGVVGPWAVAAALVAGGLLGAARAACLLATLLLPTH